MNLRTRFGQNARKRRKELGISQEELAMRIGTDQGYVSLLETGQMNTTLDMIERICEALECEVGDLV